MKKTWNTQKCHLAFISLFIVTLLLFSAEVSGKNYYFSSSNGDDSRTPTQAQDPVTPWKTIDKLNSFFSSILPGDSVLFKKGDSFYGSIQIKKSGTSTLPIVIGAYGTGENPIITAFQTVIGWTNLGGNIWESSATNCNPTLNMVTIDGAIAQLGRYPNSTFLTYESFSGTSSITDNQLTATPNWTGAEVVIRTSSYNAVRQLITNHNSNTITYSGGSTTPTANFGYFIQKDPKTLDTTGEWYLKTSTKKLQMYFGNNNPNTYIIKASALDTLLYCKDINYITVSNINFEGANAYGIHITRGTGIVISNCEMNLNGGYGIYSISNTNFKMQSCTILNSLHTGAMIGGINSVVSHNTIRRSGLIIGRNMGSGGYHGIEAINVPGNIVEYNTIDSSGRDGLFMKGINSISRYNIITYFGLTLDDCGGIYTSGTAMTGRKIYNNIILYGIGNRAGAVGTGSSCEGIYLDEPITGVEVTGNTVAHCGSSGLRYHNAYNIVARENTLYDNTYNIHIIKSNAFAAYSRNLTFKSNISVCKTLSQFAFRIYNYISDDPLLYGTSDSNYFCRPIADTYTTQTKVISASTSRTLEGWQAFSIQDMNSKKSPATIIDVQDILFEYNASLINKVVLLNATYLGVDSTLYNNSITLLPYTSIVLIKIPGSDKNQMPSILNQNFQLNENSVNATTVGTVIATDPDTGQTKTFSIVSGNTGGAFAINVSTGILTVANTAALNFEVIPSFALVVKVQDNGTPGLSSQANVNISLIDINEAPVISNQAFTISENSVNATTVGTVIATDPDAGQTKTFSIVSGNTGGAFAINASTGVLTIANSAVLNFEVTPSFALVVKVQDNGSPSMSSQATITISLTDVNEAPVINNQSFSIAENSVNATTVGTVIATDPDAGQTKTFSIVSGNTGGAFAINASTGVLTIANSAVLNFEVTPSFALVVKVQDNGTPGLSSQANVNISLIDVNEAPVISNQAFTIAENSVNGTTVGTVIATDPDTGQTKTFSIVSGNTSGTFAINALTGILTVANTAALNFEITPSFALVVKVQDNGTPGLSSQANVNISLIDVNEAPVISNQAFTIAENSVNATTVGTVIATDPDAGQTNTFSIVSGNTGGAFAINASTGVLTIANSAVLNFEVIPSFALVVKVQDNGSPGLSSQATITISLTDVNEAPVINNQSFSIAENSVNATTVGTVIATDPDAGQTKTFSIVSGNTGGAFAINASTGVLTIANSAVLNFEVTPSFTLVVKVQDNGSPVMSSQTNITISLTEVKKVPIIYDQAFTLAQSAPNGTLVGIVEAINPNVNNTLTYSILTGNTEGMFTINSLNGEILVSNISPLKSKSSLSFALIVKVQDNRTPILSSQATVTISLTDENRAPVINIQSFSIAENSANGTTVGIVVATDPDYSQALSYSIVSGNTNNAFAINANTGIITVVNQAILDFETMPFFGLMVEVQDNGTPSLSSQAYVVISLANINEAPVMEDIVKSVVEKSAPGTEIGYLSASDPDTGQTLKYIIVSGNEKQIFSLNPSSGLLSVADSSKLIYSRNPLIKLVVMVQDNGIDALSTLAFVTINILPDPKELTQVPELSNVEDISIYPNPTADIININLGKAENQTVGIRIFSMNGSEIYSTIIKGEKKVVINMEHEKAGTYIAALKLNGKVYTRKIVVKN